MSKRNKELRAKKEEQEGKRVFRNIIIVLLVLALILIVAFSVFL